MEQSSAIDQGTSSSSSNSYKSHAVFHYFMPDKSKQDVAITDAHNKK